MLTDDKALVERLRDESIVGMPMENEAADRIETLNAMLKAAEESLGDQLAARKEQADEIVRLHEALAGVMPYVSARVFGCQGDYCSEPLCYSCNGSDDAYLASRDADVSRMKACNALDGME